jgi:hypothetical protein
MGTMEGVRERILDRLLRTVALLGAIAYVPSVYASVAYGLWFVAAVDSAAFALIVAAAVFRRLGYRLRLAVLIGACLAIAGAVLYSTGPYGAGYIWLLCAIFLASLLERRRLFPFTTAAAIAILGGYALLIALGAAPAGQPLVSLAVISANLIVVGALLAAAARSLISGLEGAHAEELRLNARVGRELEAARAAEASLIAQAELKEKLLKELHHRVHNSMQVILSLLDIESANRDEGSLERITRRVRALSLADDLFLSHPEDESAELRELVAGAIVAHRASSEAELPFSTGSFSYDIPAAGIGALSIAIAEIIAALAELALPVAVELSGPEGARRLAFRWAGSDAATGEAIAARLRDDPLVAGIAPPGGLAFEPRDAEGKAAISLDLPRE